MSRGIITLTVIALSGLLGCCPVRTCVEPRGPGMRVTSWFEPSLAPLKTHRGETWSDSMFNAVREAGSKPMNVLILSGGGSNGAFGAGFLNGLAARDDNPDLVFDIVTGISTGALQATHVFLGPDYFEQLKLYTQVTNEDIYEERGILDLVCASSLYDTAPLRSLIERFITMEIMVKVAAAYDAGRRLFIGTVNLDTSELKIWDMGAIAAPRNEDALRHYHDILMAASAIPVAFPPILIKKETSKGEVVEGLYTDGGAREILFFRQFMLNLRNAVRMGMQRMGPSIARLDQAALTVIVNGKVGLERSCTQERIVPIGIRSLEALMDQSKIDSVFRAYAIACANHISFRMIRIPDEMEMDSHSYEFNPDTMQRLYTKGFEMAQQTPIPWVTKPPTAEDLDPMCK